MTAIPRKHIKGLQIYSMLRAWSRLAQQRDHFLISGNIDNDNLFCYSVRLQPGNPRHLTGSTLPEQPSSQHRYYHYPQTWRLPDSLSCYESHANNRQEHTRCVASLQHVKDGMRKGPFGYCFAAQTNSRSLP